MPADPDDIYEDRILEHFEEPFHRGPCPRATHAHQDDNPLCGDVVRMELQIEQDRVQEAFFQADGCLISQAAASMLAERINGCPVGEIKDFSAEDMLALFGPKLTPNRQKCCLLCWRVLQAALYAPVTAANEG